MNLIDWCMKNGFKVAISGRGNGWLTTLKPFLGMRSWHSLMDGSSEIHCALGETPNESVLNLLNEVKGKHLIYRSSGMKTQDVIVPEDLEL